MPLVFRFISFWFVCTKLFVNMFHRFVKNKQKHFFFAFLSNKENFKKKTYMTLTMLEMYMNLFRDVKVF